jgi:glycosyltransferase involved in cell wall biosynthesis
MARREARAAPVVTVIIPVLNGEKVLGGCLDALADQEQAPTFEVVVVDNGSTDGTADLVRSHRVRARVLDEPTRGPYAARNRGIEAAAGEILAFTDADCIPDERWLAAGVAAVRAGGDVVGGAIVQRSSAHPTVWERYDRATYLRQDRFVREQGFAATANLLVRHAVVRDIGGFRPELVASGDLEFGRRATAAGYRLEYADDARILHHPRATLRDVWELHRKLGSGFAELARAGLRGSAWRDPALRIRLRDITHMVAEDGPYVQRRRLAPVHAVALGGRWVGRLTGRG